ncbi:hypothetical protein [Methylophilus sp. 13]|uniref:hypothetical protein n=1 Tax=Methylophilus sp. 13 TaxID=2781018 RepID=UPI001E3BA71A|nr:hypothetical protein [Methylophilus sp. 13]
MMRAQTWLHGVLAVGLLSVSSALWAGATPGTVTTGAIPEDEQAFVDKVGKMSRTELIALLGEPARAEDVKLKDSGRVVASIWHYHNINKDAKGAYYPTTELDIVEDQVSVVVFLNNDGSDASSGQTYEVPNPNPAGI